MKKFILGIIALDLLYMAAGYFPAIYSYKVNYLQDYDRNIILNDGVSDRNSKSEKICVYFRGMSFLKKETQIDKNCSPINVGIMFLQRR